MLKELGHYLRRDSTKGSKGEIEEKTERFKYPKNINNILKIYYL